MLLKIFIIMMLVCNQILCRFVTNSIRCTKVQKIGANKLPTGLALKFTNVQYLGSYTVDEIIIAIIKMRNNFCYPLKKEIFFNLLYCSPFSYRSSNFVIAKVVALNLFASIFVLFLQIGSWLLFCIASHIVITLPCRFFTLLKALAKSNGNLFAIAFKSEKERQLSLSRLLEERFL